MPIIIETEDGETYGPGQPYGYQGQYQGQRQPGIERANIGSVPQRVVRPDIGFDRAGPVRETSRGANIGFDRAGPAGPPSNIGRDRAGGFGWNDFRQILDERVMIDSGQYLASRFGGGLDDAAGMNGDAMGMIEGAGFDVASKTTDDRVVERLWKQAVNSLPIGTPQPQLIEEWEKLKEEFYRRKYGE